MIGKAKKKGDMGVMKKIGIVLMLVFVLGMITACSTSKGGNVTLADAISAFENEGIEVNPEEKPFFQMINASDGVIFYIDGKVVKIYEFASEKDYKKGLESVPAIKDWPKIGNVVLETSNERAVEIFSALEK